MAAWGKMTVAQSGGFVLTFGKFNGDPPTDQRDPQTQRQVGESEASELQVRS